MEPMNTVRETVQYDRTVETNNKIVELIQMLADEGYATEFGSIGQRTTYALLTKDDIEVVGYTFIRNLKYKNESVGKLKALQQAIARKKLMENPPEVENTSEQL